MISRIHFWRAALLSAAVVASSLAADEFPPQPSIPFHTPEQQLKLFQLPEGYRLELVIGEPVIKEPVAAVFDGNGRMFVAEMRTYMQDIDGSNELTKKSLVSLHWSSKRDGRFDKHTVFIDQLLLPRMILALGPGELLVNETDTQDIHLYRDTNGDGVADEKKLWYAGGPRGGNLEHQQSGLIWANDNWMYMAVNSWRLRWQGYGKEPLQEPTPGNGGQWGLAQDDFGKPWFVNAGGERGPLNFQTPIVYGAFNTTDQIAPGYMTVWPAVGLADVQGGLSRRRVEDNTLNHFTATCGAEVFRGDRLPEDLRGDLLFSEPVGRLIRRTKISLTNGLTYLRNAYETNEFIRSTDPSFRVVNMNTAPDGTLYLIDMYRGIIQEGAWVREGSYLRKVVKQHGMDKIAGNGRIWRLTHQGFQPGPQPRMNEETSAQLVAHLEHPNGWWRDTAQKLLVLRADKSVAPALRTLARSSANPLARMHALWTLEGLGALDAADVRAAMKDAQPTVRAAAIRASETLYKVGDTALTNEVRGLLSDADSGVAMQALLTAKLLKFPDATKLVQFSAMNATNSPGLREIALQLLAPPRSWGNEFSGAEKKLLATGNGIFNELCFACHNPDGKGTPVEGHAGMTLAPSLSGSRTVTGHKDGLVLVLLKGLAGPVNGKTYEAQMVPMESNNDEWIASVASFVRNSFGNRAGTVTAKDVGRVRAAAKARTEPWTTEELRLVLPQAPLANRREWKITASHNTSQLAKLIDGDAATRWDTRISQTQGMWLQIEFPRETAIAGLGLDYGASAGDWPRGFRVELSTNGMAWAKPVASGIGKPGLTEIEFAPAKTKFIRITQTGEKQGTFWSVHELDVLEPPAQKAILASPAKKKETYE